MSLAPVPDSENRLQAGTEQKIFTLVWYPVRMHVETESSLSYKLLNTKYGKILIIHKYSNLKPLFILYFN